MEACKPIPAFAIVLLTLAIILVGLFAMYGRPAGGEVSQVRVRNGTGMPLGEVMVNGIGYGAIPAGGVSDYRDMTRAYEIADVSLVMNGKRMFLKPDDYVGEKALGRGRFTYVIVAQRGATMLLIDLKTVRDGD